MTKGHRWRVFGIVLIAALGPGLAVYVLGEIMFRFLDRNTLIFVDFMLRVFAISAGTIIGATTYQFLRTAKKGHVVETLAEVFA